MDKLVVMNELHKMEGGDSGWISGRRFDFKWAKESVLIIDHESPKSKIRVHFRKPESSPIWAKAAKLLNV